MCAAALESPLPTTSSGRWGCSQLDNFKAGFRHVDVLLIDDVQFLERKTRTEEKFFHTFNALTMPAAKSSDLRPPTK